MPKEGKGPSAYIAVLDDRKIGQSFGHDALIAIQNILLGATEKGLRGCIIALIRQEGLSNAHDIPKRFEILLVLAFGVPRE
ncbi:MAG: nitroreductase family protein [Methanosarcinaceae archaeon]|nr:nitroreductase family protein [Methanosarcinaceae archaeon]